MSGVADDPSIRDPGLQPERTRLSWRRTVLATTVVALLAVRIALVKEVPIATALALLLWLAVLWLSHRRITAMTASRPSAAGRSLTAVALAICGYAVLGAVLVMLAE